MSIDVPAGIAMLAEEILEKIFTDAYANQPSHALSISLTCKKWHPIALPLLYRGIYIQPRATAVIKALEDNKEKGYGDFVKVGCHPMSSCVIG
jgi:hypothetical protein